MLLGLSLTEFIDESGGGIEPKLPSLMASQKHQNYGEMGLAGARGALFGGVLYPVCCLQFQEIREVVLVRHIGFCSLSGQTAVALAMACSLSCFR